MPAHSPESKHFSSDRVSKMLRYPVLPEISSDSWSFSILSAFYLLVAPDICDILPKGDKKSPN